MAKRIDITQTAAAKALEAAAVAAHAVYTEKAELAAVTYKAAGRPQKGGYFDAASKEYAAFQNALEDKQEAYQKWMRAASQHGHYLLPKSEEV